MLTQVRLVLGGAMDVAFIGSTAYALVTVVGSDVGGSDTVGHLPDRRANSFTADRGPRRVRRGQPPDAEIYVATGVEYAIEPFRGGFLVTDGHHNRVYDVTRDGDVSEMIAVRQHRARPGWRCPATPSYMAEAGTLPHNAADGKVVSFSPGSSTVTTVAAGAPLLVDVERGRGRSTVRALAGHLTVRTVRARLRDPDTGSRSSRRTSRPLQGSARPVWTPDVAGAHRHHGVRRRARQRHWKSHAGHLRRAMSLHRAGSRGRGQDGREPRAPPSSRWLDLDEL